MEIEWNNHKGIDMHKIWDIQINQMLGMNFVWNLIWMDKM
jgi:hypothetical protein